MLLPTDQDIPPVAREAMEFVRRMAVERNAVYASFTLWVAFLRYDEVYDLAPVIRDGRFSSESKRQSALLGHLSRPENNVLVPLMVVVNVAQRTGDILARRVYETILEDEHAGREIRKPVAYYAAITDGFAVAVGIDDRFWDNESW